MADSNELPAPDPLRLTDRVLSGRFRVRRPIAVGGMAGVYEVEHLITRRLGALKLLRSEYLRLPEAIERLIREASAAGRIENPHIVQTLDAGRLDTGEPYIFMELLDGESLDAAIQRQVRLPFSEATDIVAQAATALCAAHRVGILHRDIKPGNLFLLTKPKGFVKVLDFGVSKFSAVDLATLTKEGRALGTFFYMPPEQMMGAKRVDARADVYSLGVVLYECVTGAPPFRASTIPELGLAMSTNTFTPVSVLRADTPPGFDAMLARSLRADPKERYATMRAFQDELLRFQDKAMVQRTVGVGGAPAPADAGRAHHVQHARRPDSPQIHQPGRAGTQPGGILHMDTISPTTDKKRR